MTPRGQTPSTRLRHQRKLEIQKMIAAYAAEVAGTSDDLNVDLEAASLEPWREKRLPGKRPGHKR